jgi:hypothetical protein
MTKICYDVGYGKLPLHTRFRKGQSGNPKGRGKGTRNFATIFMRAMSQSVTITEYGRQHEATTADSALVAETRQSFEDVAEQREKPGQCAELLAGVAQ